jgi:hypothetical protein
MNDFLQSLRNGQLKRQDRGRKNYDNPQYRHKDRSGHRDKRHQSNRHSNQQADLTEIKKLLTMMNENAELTRIAQERTADALEKIAGCLNGLTDGSFAIQLNTSVAAEQAPAEAPAQASGDGRDAALATIHKLRTEGSSFEEIADYLVENRIPTFSGKGAWRAQNVSRIYNTYLKSDAS